MSYLYHFSTSSSWEKIKQDGCLYAQSENELFPQFNQKGVWLIDKLSLNNGWAYPTKHYSSGIQELIRHLIAKIQRSENDSEKILLLKIDMNELLEPLLVRDNIFIFNENNYYKFVKNLKKWIDTDRDYLIMPEFIYPSNISVSHICVEKSLNVEAFIPFEVFFNYHQDSSKLINFIWNASEKDKFTPSKTKGRLHWNFDVISMYLKVLLDQLLNGNLLHMGVTIRSIKAALKHGNISNL